MASSDAGSASAGSGEDGSGGDGSGGAGSAAAGSAAESEIFELEPVADGVYATVVRAGISPSQYAASLIVLRTDHVLVVDSRHDYDSATELLDTIAALTDLPVRYLVNTHFHGDHVQGNAAFRDRFPDVRIVGGSTIVEDIETLGRERLDEEIERVSDRVRAARGWLDEGARDGTPLTEEELDELPGQIRSAEAYLAARAAIELVPPEITVDRVLELADAEPRVEVIKVGPAHTRGDVVVHILDVGVLAIGDLIEDGFPWFGDGYPAGWREALGRIAELDAALVLPAHGPVLRDPEMFATQRRFVERITAVAAEGVAAGRSLEQTAAAADLSQFEAHFTRRLADSTDEERAERFAGFVEEVLARAWAEAAGEIEPGA